MSPRTMEGGPGLADMEFKADQEETAVVKPIEEEAKLAQAVDDIFEPKSVQKTTRESLEASNAGYWMKEYFNKANRDPMRTDMMPYDKLENAAFIAQNYLTALVEQVNNPNVKIGRIQSTGEEAKMKQFAQYVVGEWNREKARRMASAARIATKEAGRMRPAA